ncbi:sugar ABC transporter substrate-binding protein [Paenibacillus sp. NPDC056933]|uniref:sugar ABC transporter substrate-binding protein n=1 Tax=Paenibacillus sp. NPDC056933 TaxID=3345968 RepID=UPI003636416A
MIHHQPKMASPLFLLCLACVWLLLGGCYGANDSSPRSEDNAAVPLPAPPSSDKQLTFGIIYPMVNDTYEMITKDAEAAAADYPARLLVQAPEEANVEQQMGIMEMMIKRKVDGIAVAPLDSQALAPVINKAVSQGIPVICFESDAPSSSRQAFIGADNVRMGTLSGEAINELLGGSGMILVQSGISDMLSQQEREYGLRKYLQEHTRIDILDMRHNEGSEEHATQQLEQMISDHPHFSALINLDFISGSSSVLVWKAKGLKRFNLALGLTPALQQSLSDGQISKIISQNEHQWGQKIVDTLMRLTQGDFVPEKLNTDVMVIDAEAP